MIEGISTGGIVAVVLGIFKYLDYVTRKKLDSEVVGQLKTLNHEVSSVSVMTQSLLDSHQKYDENGVPLWYVPRGWEDTQEKIIDVCREISATQKELSTIQKMIASTLDRLENRLDKR